MNGDATSEIKEILEQPKIFTHPKPSNLIYHLARISTSVVDNDIILDFFSGSATTAHAVMKLNAEDGGNRKFILVQFPEPCAPDTEAFKAGYQNICEIGKERIRRAGEKIKAELEAKQDGQKTLELEEENKIDPDMLDIGFKVFKLDSSNLKKWQPTENLEKSLYDNVENYIEGRTEFDLVYEIMIKYGIDLTLPIEEHILGKNKVYSIGLGALMICLDEAITADIAPRLVQLKKELAPETLRIVLKDNGFASDSDKTNVKETLRNAGVEEFVTV